LEQACLPLRGGNAFRPAESHCNPETTQGALGSQPHHTWRGQFWGLGYKVRMREALGSQPHHTWRGQFWGLGYKVRMREARGSKPVSKWPIDQNVGCGGAGFSPSGSGFRGGSAQGHVRILRRLGSRFEFRVKQINVFVQDSAPNVQCRVSFA
jgi:hypothetical protein